MRAAREVGRGDGRGDGALDRAGLRRVVAVLGVVQIVSWGCLYYAFAALQSSIAADTGWSPMAVTGAFSLAQLVSAGAGLWVGRHLDAHGPRRVMTGGSLVAVPGMLGVALAPDLGWFYAGWVLVGAAMAGLLYPPAFAALTRWGGERRVVALTSVTLVAGLASTVFAPLASVLDHLLGWRGAYLVLLGGLLAITLPMHWWGLGRPWQPRPEDGSEPNRPAGPPTRGTVVRSGPFVRLAVAHALTALAVHAVVVNLVPMLLERGMSRDPAVLALGVGGVGQVLGRLGYARFAAATSVTTRGVLVVGGIAVATAVLALAPPSAGVLIGLGTLLGLARGVHTLVQATAVTDRWGTAGYARLNGVLTAPALVAAATAPFVGAALAALLGTWAEAFLVLAGLAAVAAVLIPGTSPGRRPGGTSGTGSGEDGCMSTPSRTEATPPQVVFACVRNGGRSVISRVLTEHYAGDRVRALSAGTRPGEHIHPEVAEVLEQLGLDTSAEQPTLLTRETVAASTLAITLGCGEQCPYVPGVRYVDWPVADPGGQDEETVRAIVADLDRRVRDLLSELVPGLELPPSVLA